MLVFLVNPSASGERGYRVSKKLERGLLRTRTECQVYVTDGIGEARQPATKLAEVPDNKELALIVVGGDGMSNEVLGNARLSERLRFGLIPVRRDSDLVRRLKLPVMPLGCLKCISALHEGRPLDYDVVESGGNEPLHHRFLVSCGVSFGVEWLSELYAFKQRRGRHSWLLWFGTWCRESLRILFRARCTRGCFETDSGQWVEFGHLFLSSTQLQPVEAGDIHLANWVPLSDGQLTISALNTQSRLQRVRLLLLSWRLQPEVYAGVRVYRCQELHLRLDEALSFHTDGEGRGSRQGFTVRCMHWQICLLC